MEQVQDRLRDLIDWRVGRALPVLPTGVKQPKISNPIAYRGDTKHDAFITFLEKFLGWLRAHNICGPETDSHRVTFLGQNLEGAASDWFNDEVDNPRRRNDFNSFADVICAMHHRFVHANTAQQCTLDFESCKYTVANGVE